MPPESITNNGHTSANRLPELFRRTDQVIDVEIVSTALSTLRRRSVFSLSDTARRGLRPRMPLGCLALFLGTTAQHIANHIRNRILKEWDRVPNPYQFLQID